MPFTDLRFTAHVRQRMQERAITQDDVSSVLATGTIIEDYPTTLPYASYLVLGWRGARPLHIVAADNPADQVTLVITVYEPDPLQWDAEFKVRRS